MNRRIATLFVGGVLALALFGGAAAGPLQDGATAYQRGDYAQLGWMYANGDGVPRDLVQAYMWFNLAASLIVDAATRRMAEEDRDRMAVELTPAQIAEAQRLAREWAPK